MQDKQDLKTLIGTNIGKYIITRYIGSGSFGNVFEGKNKLTNELVALKIPIVNENKNGERLLLEEAKVYKKISNKEKGVASMKVMKRNDRHIIIMDLLGPSLDSMMTKYKKLSLKTIIRLAISMLETIKYIHSCGYIHRDIKPDNFVLGYNQEECNKVYCIDFGLAKRYIKKNGDHIDMNSDKKFCGTVRYASIAAHNNMEQSRKDDLESIGYILVYLYKAKLPWQNIKHKDKKERYKLVGDAKMNIQEDELCLNMPKEFAVYMKYVKTLDFDEKPRYNALINMFKKLYDSRNYKNDKLEWES